MIQVKVAKKLLSPSAKLELDVHMEIKQNEFVILFGKSGAGKTTLLKIVAGLTQADFGVIKVSETHWLHTNSNINLSPQKRDLGFVFQDYALFPNMTVQQNIEYACKNKDQNLVQRLLTRTGLTEFANSYPNKISGGQQQRVALARALARNPKLLLLDEPLSALDTETRLVMQTLLQELHKEFNPTIIMVSHDIAEACKLADKIYMLDSGKITSFGKPVDVFTKGLQPELSPCLTCKYFTSQP